MEQTEPVMPKKSSRRALVFLAISLFLLSIVLYTAQSRGYFSTSRRAAATSPTAVPTIDPRLNMKLEGTTQFSLTDNATLTLKASSAGRDISGFDALINFDPAYFSVVSTKSADDRYQVIPFNKEGVISITGTKVPSYKGQALLDETDLVRMVLKPKKKGTTTVTIQTSAGNEKTKMVDAASTVLTPQLHAITLAIY